MRRALLLAGLLLAVLSGCIGLPPSDGGDAVPTATTTVSNPTTTATPTPSSAGTPTTAAAGTGTPSYGDCPYVLQVDALGSTEVPADGVREYGSLTDRQRDEFDRALGSGTAEIGETDDGWVEIRGVRDDGSTYPTAVMVC